MILSRKATLHVESSTFENNAGHALQYAQEGPGSDEVFDDLDLEALVTIASFAGQTPQEMKDMCRLKEERLSQISGSVCLKSNTFRNNCQAIEEEDLMRTYEQPADFHLVYTPHDECVLTLDCTLILDCCLRKRRLFEVIFKPASKMRKTSVRQGVAAYIARLTACMQARNRERTPLDFAKDFLDKRMDSVAECDDGEEQFERGIDLLQLLLQMSSNAEGDGGSEHQQLIEAYKSQLFDTLGARKDCCQECGCADCDCSCGDSDSSDY